MIWDLTNLGRLTGSLRTELPARARWTLWAIVVAAWPLAIPARADVPTERIDLLVQRKMEEIGIPGVGLAVVKSGKVVHCRGFGVVRSGGPPVTADTPFLLGSTTKSFTALVTMQLCEAGKVDLDAPVVRYLPWFKVADPESTRRMTVRHLLNQTSGFGTITGRTHFLDDDRGPGVIEAQTRRLADAPVTGPPGGRFVYSNANFLVLGAVIEAVTGKPFGETVQERIFRPLEMRHSYVSMDEARRHGLASGHRLFFGHPVLTDDAPWSTGNLPAGMVISSASDLGRYLLAHVTGGKVLNPGLSQAGFQALHRPAAFVWGRTSYAMGWFVRSSPERTLVFHGGDWQHYHSNLEFAPETGLAVAFLANANTFVMNTRLNYVAHQVLLVAGGEEPPEIRESWTTWGLYAAFVAFVSFRLVILLVALVWLRSLRHSMEPGARRRRVRLLTAHGCVDMVLGVGFLVVVPWYYEASIQQVARCQLDLGLGIVVAAVWLLVWGPLCVALTRVGRLTSPSGSPAPR